MCSVTNQLHTMERPDILIAELQHNDKYKSKDHEGNKMGSSGEGVVLKQREEENVHSLKNTCQFSFCLGDNFNFHS